MASASNPKATRVRVTTTSFDERMSNIEFHSNDVNGTRAFSEGVASDRCPVDQQRRPDRHPVTADQRQDGQRRTTNGCLNVMSGANQRGESTEKDY